MWARVARFEGDPADVDARIERLRAMFDAGDLPPGCNGMNQCPSGSMSCATNPGACPSGTYCDAGSLCCIGIIL